MLGHAWSSGGYWAPITTKLEALAEASQAELTRANRPSLYGLLNFFREYVPAFAELTEPIRELLGQDAQPWTPAATRAVHQTVQSIMEGPRWLAMDPGGELQAEARVQPTGFAVVLMQRDPERPLTWAPVATWGRRLVMLEVDASLVELELRALCDSF